MALVTNHPYSEQTVWAYGTSVATGVVGYTRAPFRGKVVKVGTVISGATTTADATATSSIAGTNITGGVVTITQSGSAAGQVNTALTTAANLVNEDDAIGFTMSGSGTGGGPVAFFAVVRQGPF